MRREGGRKKVLTNEGADMLFKAILFQPLCNILVRPIGHIYAIRININVNMVSIIDFNTNQMAFNPFENSVFSLAHCQDSFFFLLLQKSAASYIIII
jgi:hypothetical protein